MLGDAYMSIQNRFYEGDRVKAEVPTQSVKRGMVGTVQRVYLSVTDTYDVQFDDLPTPHILFGDQLTLVESANKSPS